MLIAGFQLDHGYSLSEYDAAAASRRLRLLERWATWDRQPYEPGGGYAVSVHASDR
jgi:hypothetical protein